MNDRDRLNPWFEAYENGVEQFEELYRLIYRYETNQDYLNLFLKEINKIKELVELKINQHNK